MARSLATGLSGGSRGPPSAGGLLPSSSGLRPASSLGKKCKLLNEIKCHLMLGSGQEPWRILGHAVSWPEPHDAIHPSERETSFAFPRVPIDYPKSFFLGSHHSLQLTLKVSFITVCRPPPLECLLPEVSGHICLLYHSSSRPTHRMFFVRYVQRMNATIRNLFRFTESE